MFVQGDIARLKRRFWNIISPTIFASSLLGGGIILANDALVQVWTSSAISWNSEADILLGGKLLLATIRICFVPLFGVIGNCAPVSYIFLMGGLLFALLALTTAHLCGINGVLSTSLNAHLASSLLIALFASRKYLHPFYNLLQYSGPGVAILMMASVASLFLRIEALSLRSIRSCLRCCSQSLLARQGGGMCWMRNPGRKI
jgi:hypothetical protein